MRVFFRHYDRNPAIFKGSGGYVEELLTMRGKNVRLRAVDDALTSQIGGPRGIGLWPFTGADEFYHWGSAKHVINGVRVYVFRTFTVSIR